MTVSLADFFTKVARDLHETDNTFSSGSWSAIEMLAYLNNAEREFLLLTGIWKTDVSVLISPGSTILFDRPLNTMDIDRMSFCCKPLRRQTSYDLELEDRKWRINILGYPQYWHEDHLPNSQYEINKVPAAGGELRIFADYLPDPYTDIDTEDIHLRDCWEQYLRWRVLSLALTKDCEDQDLGRSNYSRQRFMLAVMLARRLIRGIAEANLRG